MTTLGHSRSGWSRVMGVAAVATLIAASPLAAQQSRRDAVAGMAAPARRAPDPPPAPPPDVPPAIDRAPAVSLTVTYTVEADDTVVTERRVVRSADRAYIAAGLRDWYFERNPVDGRRVTGALVDHAARTIVLHDESELRNHLGVRGWLDVVALGFDPGSMAARTPTGHSREVGGVRFAQYAEPGDPGASIWWSDTYQLASGFRSGSRGAAVRVEVTALQEAVDPEVLRAPRVRYPGYEEVDLSEWLEGR